MNASVDNEPAANNKLKLIQWTCGRSRWRLSESIHRALDCDAAVSFFRIKVNRSSTGLVSCSLPIRHGGRGSSTRRSWQTHLVDMNWMTFFDLGRRYWCGEWWVMSVEWGHTTISFFVVFTAKTKNHYIRSVAGISSLCSLNTFLYIRQIGEINTKCL